MTEIKAIVIEHYPVERLPDELRNRLGAQGAARITIEPDSPATGE